MEAAKMLIADREGKKHDKRAKENWSSHFVLTL